MYDLHLNPDKGGYLKNVDPQVQLGSIWLVQAKTGDIEGAEFTEETAHIEVSDLVFVHFVSMGKILPVGLHFLTYLIP